MSPDCSIIRVRQQQGLGGEAVASPKTGAGFRGVDLHRDLAKTLRDFIGGRKSDFLFQTRAGRYLIRPAWVARALIRCSIS